MRGGEFGTEPRKKTDQIVEDKNVPVAILPAPDADSRAGHGFCDLRGQGSVDEFQHEGLHPRFIKRLGIGDEAVGLGIDLAFDAVTTFLDDPLGKHAEVANDGNLFGNDGLEHREDFGAALDFHNVRTGLAEEAGIFHGEIRRGATSGGKVGGNECFFRPPGHGARVVDHVGHGHLGGVGVAEDDHAQRVAHKQKIEPAAIEQASCRVIVGGQTGEAPAGGFGGAERSRCGFHGAAEY